jgi:hypothetical protein
MAPSSKVGRIPASQVGDVGSKPTGATIRNKLVAKVTEHIKGMSTFQFYRKGYLHYQTNDTGFAFHVPIEDIGDASFNRVEKSMTMMRYIRKMLEYTG